MQRRGIEGDGMKQAQRAGAGLDRAWSPSMPGCDDPPNASDVKPSPAFRAAGRRVQPSIRLSAPNPSPCSDFS